MNEVPPPDRSSVARSIRFTLLCLLPLSVPALMMALPDLGTPAPVLRGLIGWIMAALLLPTPVIVVGSAVALMLRCFSRFSRPGEFRFQLLLPPAIVLLAYSIVFAYLCSPGSP